VGTPTSGVAVSGDTAFVATHDGGLSAFDTTTGEPRYRVTLPGAAAGAPVILGAHLLVPTVSGDVLRLDIRNGNVLGSRRVRAPVIAEPTIADGQLILRTSVGISVLSTDNLSIVREISEPSFLLPGQTTRPALLTNGTVLLHTDSGTVRAWREGSSSPSWSSTSLVSGPSMDPILAPRPEIGGNDPAPATVLTPQRMAVLVGGLAVGVRLLDPETGSESWRALPGTTPVGAAVVGETILVALLDRRLVRLGSDGRMMSSMLLAGVPASQPFATPGSVVMPLMGGKTELLQASSLRRIDEINHGGTLMIPAATVPGFAFVALRERAVFSLRL